MFLSEKTRLRFTPKRTRRAYDRVFKTPTAEIVLAHLADTCHATESSGADSALEMARAEGRREVWLVIQDMLRLTEADIRDAQERVSMMGETDDE